MSYILSGNPTSKQLVHGGDDIKAQPLNIFKILVYQDAKKYYYENVPYSERNIDTLD